MSNQPRTILIREYHTNMYIFSALYWIYFCLHLYARSIYNWTNKNHLSLLYFTPSQIESSSLNLRWLSLTRSRKSTSLMKQRNCKQVRLLNTGSGKGNCLCSKVVSTNHRLQNRLRTWTDRRKKWLIGLSAQSGAKNLLIHCDIFNPGPF